jgi:hypothetical protein
MRLLAVVVSSAAATAFALALASPASAMVADRPTRSGSAPRLSVDLKHGKHLISRDIYGVNFADGSFAKQVGLPVDRWGGNSTDTYNWQVRGSNHGQDYYFENFADCWEAAFNYCQSGHDYSAADAQVQQDRGTHTTTLLTLPMLGWVAKEVAYTNSNDCSYPTNVYGAQDSTDQYHPVCGNGKHNGDWVGDADPTRAGVAVGPSFSAQWIQSLIGKYGDAAHGGVGIYELGNEPQLWDETHHDFHPAPTTYDELWSKSRDLAAAVKGADPTAATLGPAEWGWPNYFCSAADHIDQGCFPTSPDRAAHGGTDLSSWYLQQFAGYQQQTGQRLLDYFDLHYYPQGSYTPATDVTRSLYDASYTDPSWIDQKIDLIPRMRAWVHDSYPGTKTSVSEYNMGLDVTSDPRLQNVIEADTLGIFGREGLDLATFWPEDSSPVPTAAFRIFLDYDGHGHGFGDRGVRAKSSDQRQLAVYAARVGKHGPLTIVVVNKTSGSIRTRVRLHHATGRGAKAWQYAGGQLRKVHGVQASRHGVAMKFPGDSVTLIKVSLHG